jgi:hypothetical protein
MTTQHFTAAITKVGSKTVIELPFNPNETWGAKDRHHIRGTVGGRDIRGPLVLDGARAFLPLGPAWMRDSGLAVGAQVEVTLSAEGPQFEQLAPDVTAALESDPQAKALFESLATYYRNGFIKGIEGAKRPETRAARIEEMMRTLKSGKKQA